MIIYLGDKQYDDLYQLIVPENLAVVKHSHYLPQLNPFKILWHKFSEEDFAVMAMVVRGLKHLDEQQEALRIIVSTS